MQWAGDISFAVLFMCVFALPVDLDQEIAFRFSWLLVPSWLLMGLAIALRRATTGIAAVLVIAALAVHMLLGQSPHMIWFGSCFVVFSAAAYGSTALRITSAVSVFLGPVVLATYAALVPHATFFWSVGAELVADHDLTSYVLVAAIVWFGMVVIGAVAWLSGFVRRYQIRMREGAHERELADLAQARAQEQLVVEQERNRIARDMHDVVAHSLAVVVAQADGGRYAARTNPEAGEQALTTIAEIAREALVDVRGLLGQLRHSQGEGPQPGLEDVPTVLERMRVAGLDVRYREGGRRVALTQSSEIACYRVVQEALTNALRHGDAEQPVHVTAEWGDGFVLEIRNRLSPRPAPPRKDSGHGLIGMRERIALVGGQLGAGAIGDEWVVRAQVPGAPPAAPGAPSRDGTARASGRADARIHDVAPGDDPQAIPQEGPS